MHDKKSPLISKASDSTWIHRARLLFDRDEIRVPLQTTAAVLLAFVGTLFMSRENMSWGVFSALFVVQVSIGGTVTKGIYRIVGAILGAVIGVITMSIVSYRWPQLAWSQPRQCSPCQRIVA